MVQVRITDKALSETGDDLIINFEFEYGGVVYKSGVSIPIATLSELPAEDQPNYIMEQIKKAVDRIIKEHLIQPVLEGIPEEIEI